MSDIFAMFEEAEKPASVMKEPVDVSEEIKSIAKSFGYDMPQALANELALYYIDPPPWAPWAR